MILGSSIPCKDWLLQCASNEAGDEAEGEDAGYVLAVWVRRIFVRDAS
jgi:hypothetical protein